jgi:hypothetical protein
MNRACVLWLPSLRNRNSIHSQGKALVLVTMLACTFLGSAMAQSDKNAAPAQQPKKVFYSANDRQAAMHNASLFTATEVGAANIMEGPAQDKKEFQLHFNDKVICDFKTPGSQMGGKTQKFACQITRVESLNGQVQTVTADIDEDPVKVKFGADDNEVYAEVVSTRLMWALGYYADAWYPVKVECHGCPKDPESGSGAPDVRTYFPATIVRKYPGHKMYVEGDEEEGWSWKELDALNGRPTYERDGLKLLAVFLQHSDNKPPQQRLSCDKVHVDQTTHPFTTTCDTPVMLVQDVGTTLGSGGLISANDSAKMNVGNWSGKKLWNKSGTDAAPAKCEASLTKSLTAHDGLGDPVISEEGRRFLANLMCQLSDAQIQDLFKAARAADMPQYHNSDGSFKAGVTEEIVVQKWTAAFKQKREQMAAARCQWNQKPADLAAIDNPKGLATVPNFCTAKPF